MKSKKEGDEGNRKGEASGASDHLLFHLLGVNPESSISDDVSILIRDSCGRKKINMVLLHKTVHFCITYSYHNYLQYFFKSRQIGIVYAKTQLLRNGRYIYSAAS